MSNEVILKLEHLTKAYGNFYALDDVSISFRKGSVHALVGENGAGKSTLVKCVCGATRASAGTIEIDGEVLTIANPFSGFEAGIATMYQEFNLLPDLTVAQNLFIGREKTYRGGWLNSRAMEQVCRELLMQIGLNVSPHEFVKNLSTAEKQMLEISKGIAFHSKIIFMDEPSALLTETEVQALFKVIRQLSASGTTVIYISHRLEEIFEIADTVSVLKDGKHIITAPIEDFHDKNDIIKYMIGREMDKNYFAVDETREPDTTAEILRVEHLKNENVDDVSFTLYKGEILGLAGLVGAGRTEIVRAIFGADPIESGSIYVEGKKTEIKNPADAIAAGIGFVPEERAREGIILSQSISSNLSIGLGKQIFPRGFLNIKLQQRLIQEYVERLNVKLGALEDKANSLSGGNQQKAIIAKWMATHSKILIMDEPTRGVDVGAKSEIYGILSNLTKQGISIIVVSSEMPEIINICDRILVISGHRVVNEFKREEATEKRILASALPVEEAAPVGAEIVV